MVGGAVVSASMGAMSTLLPKLSALIQGEYKLQKGVKRKIGYLKDELTSMQTLLVKLANNEERLDEQDNDWRNKVRELSYDIEDCIDLFMHKMSKGSAHSNLVKKTTSKIKKIWSRHKINSLIEELNARAEKISDCHLRYKFDEPPTSQVVRIDPRLPTLFVEAERLVGTDVPREKIIELLKEGDCGQQLKVVSIVGFGGLGKTTLANQVYQKIKGEFRCSCFVPVSRNPNVSKILADMLKELGSRVDPSDDERQLINKLRAFLQDKRYFIIVDDIWSEEAWEIVKSALPENNLNSRIITTTRIASVAETCCSSVAGHVHKIQPLSNQQSQQLFFKRVFGDASVCPPHLEEMSHGILEKCHGLPLAIITIASLLAGKSNKEQWERVRNSISFAFSHQGMRDILLLSYYDLPHNLKTCLLYLSMYPEDYRIEREELVWRWIAEGFIPEVRGKSADQVAENYFNELVNRSLIQVTIDIGYDGPAYACRVHDMVLELIVSLSADGNFASVVEGQSYHGGGHTIRRLSVQSKHVGDEVMQEIMDKWSHVRSISFYGFQEQGILCLQELYSLRVLVFDRSSRLGNQHVKHIGSFFRLTFLCIGCTEVTELPESIGDLRYLQTLDIKRSGIKKLPPSIGRLQKLVRLIVSTDVELPDEIGDVQALQELSSICCCSIKVVEALGRLTKLKRLQIEIAGGGRLGCDTEQYEEALKSSLAAMGKHGLQSLYVTKSDILVEELMDILCCTVPYLWELAVEGCSSITRLSKQIVSFVNLSDLILSIERIKQDDLCILGGIPALLSADLTVGHAPDEQLTIRSQQFRCLKEFSFWISQVQGGGLEMSFLREAMPELRCLSLVFGATETESKMGFAFSFEHLASLEHISVSIDSDGATRCRVEAAEAAIRNAVSIHPGRPTLDLHVEGTTIEDNVDEGEDRSGYGMDEVL